MPAKDALSYCNEHNGVPVAIETEDEQNAVKTFLSRKYKQW